MSSSQRSLLSRIFFKDPLPGPDDSKENTKNIVFNSAAPKDAVQSWNRQPDSQPEVKSPLFASPQDAPRTPPDVTVYVPTPELQAVQPVDPPDLTVYVPAQELQAVQPVDPPDLTVYVPTPELQAVQSADPPDLTVYVPTPELQAVQPADPPEIAALPVPDAAALRFCTKCGQKQTKQSRFCTKCGAEFK